MERAEYKGFYISEDGTIVRDDSGDLLKDKIEKMKKRVGTIGQESPTDSPIVETEGKRARIIFLIVSFFMPLVGVMIYFWERKEVENPTAYLKAAACGLVFSFVLSFL